MSFAPKKALSNLSNVVGNKPAVGNLKRTLESPNHVANLKKKNAKKNQENACLPIGKNGKYEMTDATKAIENKIKNIALTDETEKASTVQTSTASFGSSSKKRRRPQNGVHQTVRKVEELLPSTTSRTKECGRLWSKPTEHHRVWAHLCVWNIQVLLGKGEGHQNRKVHGPSEGPEWKDASRPGRLAGRGTAKLWAEPRNALPFCQVCGSIFDAQDHHSSTFSTSGADGRFLGMQDRCKYMVTMYWGLCSNYCHVNLRILFQERMYPVIDDFVYISDDAYSREDFIRMEMELLKVLEFNLNYPLSYSFLRRYARCGSLSIETLTLARYILETSLMEYSLIDELDSKVSAASLLLALKMKKMQWVLFSFYFFSPITFVFTLVFYRLRRWHFIQDTQRKTLPLL